MLRGLQICLLLVTGCIVSLSAGHSSADDAAEAKWVKEKQELVQRLSETRGKDYLRGQLKTFRAALEKNKKQAQVLLANDQFDELKDFQVKLTRLKKLIEIIEKEVGGIIIGGIESGSVSWGDGN